MGYRVERTGGQEDRSDAVYPSSARGSHTAVLFYTGGAVDILARDAAGFLRLHPSWRSKWQVMAAEGGIFGLF